MHLVPRNDATRGAKIPRIVRPITFAHRGGRAEAPANTLPAFRRALERGARGIETDAWLAGDGEVVLVHDAMARRGLRRVRVGHTPATELARFGVPRLVDLYRELGSDFELSIDLKDRKAAEPIVALARAAGDGAPARLWLCHDDLAYLAELRTTTSDVKLVHSRRRPQVVTALERHAADLAAAGVDAMNFHHTEWSAGLVSLFHRFDVKAFAWDAQEVRHLRAMLRIGIDAIYSDFVDRLVATVAEWSDEGDRRGLD